MSAFKKIYKNTLQPTIKKKLNEQKPKLAQKAGSFILDKAIGSPYVDVVVGAAKQLKRKYLPKVGTYAAKKFIRSKYAIDKLNTIPLVIFSSILRSILGFLIFNNLKTGDKYTDFGISICLTVITTITSPFFYAMASSQTDFFERYTNIFIQDISRTEGYNNYMQKRMLYKTVIMICIIIILNFINITSRYIQEIVFHSLISSWIVEIILKIYRWKHRVTLLHYGMCRYSSSRYKLTKANIILGPLRKIKYYDTNTDKAPCLIDDYTRPSRAKIINIEDIKKERKVQRIGEQKEKRRERIRDREIEKILKDNIIIIN